MKIIFEFVGGPFDGETFAGGEGEQDDADRFYLLTDHGRIGQRFKLASSFAVERLSEAEHGDEEEPTPQPIQQHYYEVVDRLEDEGEVLVRAAYVRKDGEIVERTPPESAPSPPVEQILERLVRDTAKCMGDLYSHYWPAVVRRDEVWPPRSDENLRLHLAHGLLQRGFTIFADVSSPWSGPTSLVGIAPAQDWFLVGECRHIPRSHPGGDWVPDWWSDADGLSRFWLDPALTIDVCGGNVARVAKHCEFGWALITGLCFQPDGQPARDVERWRTREGDERILSLSRRIEELRGLFFPPIVVRDFAGHGAYYLLGLCFPIPRANVM